MLYFQYGMKKYAFVYIILNFLEQLPLSLMIPHIHQYLDLVLHFRHCLVVILLDLKWNRFYSMPAVRLLLYLVMEVYQFCSYRNDGENMVFMKEARNL